MRESLKESWDKFSLIEQMGNIGSEVGRAARLEDKDSSGFAGAANRTLELFDLERYFMHFATATRLRAG